MTHALAPFIRLAAVCCAVATLSAASAPADDTKPAPAPPPADQPDKPAPPDNPDQPRQPFPHITIDFKNKIVDLDAKVILRQGDWIELLGCSPNTREHESIVTVAAKPSHVHGALLVIGLKPGAPISWKWVGKEATMIPPTGARVAVSFVYEKDGKTIEVPAHKWVINKEKKATLPDNVWLFTGSKIVESEGHRYYKADVEGNVISVVNFGDEVLGLPTKVTNENDNGNMGINTNLIPPIGTQVKLRLRPAKPLEKKDADANGKTEPKPGE
jgi:hypothetical protein